MAKKTTEVDDTPKKKNGVEKHLAVWLLLGMIVTGLGGWGVENFGNSVASIGSVGGRDITTDDYSRALKQALNNFSRQLGTDITLEQAQSIGLDRQVLQSLVLRTAMDAEADRLGLSVGDAIVADQVKGNKSFQGAQGFDREAYRSTLQQNGLTEKSYEATVRSDIARQLLTGALGGGLMSPQTLVDTIYTYRNEERGFTYVALTEAGLPTPVASATDTELNAYYEAHLDDFTRPAGKALTYAALLPETLAPTMPVDEAAVQALYDSRADQYHVPEKRLVERLVFPTEDEAKAAKAKLDAGAASFEDLVKARGLALTDIDMGDVTKVELGAAGDAIFALTQNGVTGPLPSSLGPALYRMNGILAGQDTPLDQVKADLTKQVQLDAAKKAIADKTEAISDALAGGATIEDLAKDQGMTLATTNFAPGADDNDPITADKGFASEVGKIAVGDYPEAVALDNGGLVAIREDAETEAAPEPFDKIKDKVAAALHADRLHQALASQAADARDKIQSGASLSAFGIASVVQPVPRDHAPADLPAEGAKAVFSMQPGDVQVIDAAGWLGLVRLDTVVPAATEGNDAKTKHDQIAAELRQGLGQDISALYGQALLSQDKVSLDQAAINAVHASFH